MILEKPLIMFKKEMQKRMAMFAVSTTEFVIKFNKRTEVSHLNNQAIRSSTSAALNYGEALSAESSADFIHKLSIVMKELRETSINLFIISELNRCSDHSIYLEMMNECDQLLAIFYSTIQSTRKNQK
jgi:four helix bundle protein